VRRLLAQPERSVRLVLLALSIRNVAAALRRKVVTAEQAAPFLEDYAAEISAEAKLPEDAQVRS
jgi:hypothetical protein